MVKVGSDCRGKIVMLPVAVMSQRILSAKRYFVQRSVLSGIAILL